MQNVENIQQWITNINCDDFTDKKKLFEKTVMLCIFALEI